MKVLLICIALALECYATVENSNVTTTSTLESPQFQDFKNVPHIETTRSTVYNTTTELPPNNSSEKTATRRKKPFIRLRKIKKYTKSNSLNNNVYKVHENEKENTYPIRKAAENAQSPGDNRRRMNSSDVTFRKFKIPYENPSTSDFVREESRVISSYRFPENSGEIITENPRKIEPSRRSNFYEVQEDPFENMEIGELSFEDREPENPFRYEMNSQSFPKHMNNEIVFEQPTGQRPSLPEINNVIQNLKTQENTRPYQVTKENHVVEVNKVPLVFEHHYQGDFKPPQMQFVAHQYSYSPPTDNSDEAFQLGQILSKQVVQKLQSAQRPLNEYLGGKQEVVVNIPVRSTSSFSQQNYEKLPRGRFSGSQFQHPLVKHLLPEMSHNDYNRDTRNFQSLNENSYQLLVPKARLHPIVVEDEPIKPVYETTYLSSIPEQQLEQNHHPEMNQQYRTNSPYSVNVQQDFMDVPQYTFMSFFNLQDRIKPEAIHEVEPPNLARFNNFRNINIMKNTPLPVRHGEMMKNPEYRAKSPIEQHHQVENPISKWRSGLEMLKQQLATLIKPKPTAPSSLVPFAQHPRTPMMQSRPYWRKPQIMKLVRIPEQNYPSQQVYENQQPKENIQELDSQLNLPDNTQVTYNSNDQQYNLDHSQLPEHNSQGNQEISGHYMGNINQVEPEHQPIQSNIRHLSSPNVPTDQQAYIFAKQQTQDQPEHIYYTQEVVEENPIENMEIKNNKYSNEMNYRKPNTQTEVQIVKSVSPNFKINNPNYDGIEYNSGYTNPRIEDQKLSVELPKGYLNYQDQKNTWRTHPSNKDMNPRQILQLQRPQFREMNGHLRSNNINPYSRLRRVASEQSGQNLRRKNISYLVLMREHDDR